MTDFQKLVTDGKVTADDCMLLIGKSKTWALVPGLPKTVIDIALTNSWWNVLEAMVSGGLCVQCSDSDVDRLVTEAITAKQRQFLLNLLTYASKSAIRVSETSLCNCLMGCKDDDDMVTKVFGVAVNRVILEQSMKVIFRTQNDILDVLNVCHRHIDDAHALQWVSSMLDVHALSVMLDKSCVEKLKMVCIC